MTASSGLIIRTCCSDITSDKRAKLFSSINKCLDDGILWSKDMLADHYPC